MKNYEERELKRSCVSVFMSLPRAYEDPHEPGALGGVDPFAKAHQLKTPDAQRILHSVLSYTLHKPDGLASLPHPPCLRPRRTIANGFGGHAKTQSME